MEVVFCLILKNAALAVKMHDRTHIVGLGDSPSGKKEILDSSF